MDKFLAIQQPGDLESQESRRRLPSTSSEGQVPDHGPFGHLLHFLGVELVGKAHGYRYVVQGRSERGVVGYGTEDRAVADARLAADPERCDRAVEEPRHRPLDRVRRHPILDCGGDQVLGTRSTVEIVRGQRQIDFASVCADRDRNVPAYRASANNVGLQSVGQVDKPALDQAESCCCHGAHPAARSDGQRIETVEPRLSGGRAVLSVILSPLQAAGPQLFEDCRRRSAHRSQGSPTDDVEMEMIHDLSGLRSLVDDQPVAAVRDSPFDRHLRCNLQQVAQQRA